MPKQIAILGAGISGLSAAWFLKQRLGKNAQISVFEKGTRPGGWIQTIKKEGFLFELGPHSFRLNPSSKAAWQLMEELDLHNKMIRADPSARKRYLYLNQKLTPLPSSPLELIVSPFGKELVKGLWKDFWEPKGGKEESVHEFFTRRLGAKLSNIFVDSLVNGIYAGDPKLLSMQACFPGLYQWEQNHGGLLRGLLAQKKRQKTQMISFKDGMETLPQTLAKQLNAELHFSTHAKRIIPCKDGLEIDLSNGNRLFANHVFSAVPFYELNHLLEIGTVQIPFASVAVVNLGYSSQVLKKKGFGYLIPSSEQEDILGVIWSSSVFPQQNSHGEQTRLTVMIGGNRLTKSPSSEDFIHCSLQAISKHLKIHKKPEAIHLKMAQSAIPQYHIGHQEQISKLSLLPHLSLLGSSYYGVSLPDCIEQSKLAIESYLNQD